MAIPALGLLGRYAAEPGLDEDKEALALVVSAILTAGFRVSVRLWVVSHRSTSVTALLSIGEGWRSAAITFAEAKPLLAYYIEPVILDMQSNAARHFPDILTSLDRKRNLFFEA